MNEDEIKGLILKRKVLLRLIDTRQAAAVTLLVFIMVAVYYAVLGAQLMIENRYNIEEPIREMLTGGSPAFKEIGSHVR